MLSRLIAHARCEPAFVALIGRGYARFRDAYTTIHASGSAAGTACDDIPADWLKVMSDGWTMMFPIESERFTQGHMPARVDADSP